jgi:hypothetical protein
MRPDHSTMNPIASLSAIGCYACMTFTLFQL